MLTAVVHCRGGEREVVHTLKARAGGVCGIILPSAADAESDEVLRRGEEIHRVRRCGNQRCSRCHGDCATCDVCADSAQRSVAAAGDFQRALADLNIPRETILRREHETSAPRLREPRRARVVGDHRADGKCLRAVLKNHEVLTGRAAQRAAVDCRSRCPHRRRDEQSAGRQRLPARDGNHAAFVLTKTQTRHARVRGQRSIHTARDIRISGQRRSRAARISAHTFECGDERPVRRLCRPTEFTSCQRVRHAALGEDRSGCAAACEDSVCCGVASARHVECHRRSDIACDCTEIQRHARSRASGRCVDF